MHTVVGTAAKVNDVTQAAALLHGGEQDAWGDAGYQGVDKRQEMQGSQVKWHVAMRPGKRRALDPRRKLHELLDKAERLKASVQAKVRHPFRVIKQQFGYAKVRYRGAGEKHGAADDAVRTGQSVDSPQARHGAAGIGTPAEEKSGQWRGTNRPAVIARRVPIGREPGHHAMCMFTVASRWSGEWGFADLP